MANRLIHGPLGKSCTHVCVDMQTVFAEKTEWSTPWLPRVLPQIVEVVQKFPERTIFTRFIPADKPGQGRGMWSKFYERWGNMTAENLGTEKLELVSDLARFVPPATVIDKHVYGPWVETSLHQELQQREIDTLVITGGETDMCVLATVIGAVDFGYRVVVATDAVCSSCDKTHDAVIDLYHERFGIQIETADTEIILKNWK